jgi:hypothetical protein
MTHPWKIKGLASLDLETEESGGVPSYVREYSTNPRSPFGLVTVGGSVESNEEPRFLEEVQAHPNRFRAVLVTRDGKRGGAVINCSYKINPHQGP